MFSTFCSNRTPGGNVQRMLKAAEGRTYGRGRDRITSVAWFLAACVLGVACRAAPLADGPNLFESAAAPTPQNGIDKLVFAKLAALGLRPVLCSDAVFVRRAYLDVIGTLPPAEAVRGFLEDPDRQHKRTRLIEELLARREFADYWAMRWSDVLRIKAEFPIDLWPNAAQAYHRWVRAALAEDMPYDQFARALLTASGSNFRVGPVNFYRAVQNRTPTGLAGAVALTFMGTRVEGWPSNRVAGMAKFFSQVGYKPTGEWKEECVFWDPLGASAVPGNSAPGRASLAEVGHGPVAAQPAIPAQTNAAPVEAVLPDGVTVRLSPDRDPRGVFADWLVSPRNPWFARSIVNRVWAWLLGRGIVQEPDDLRPDNPPSNPALLAYLEREFVASHYDLKRLYRLILTSATYQFASTPGLTSPEAVANFASYPLRRLDAEVLIDAIDEVTGTTDLYTSPIPEPFTYIPTDEPATGIADGSITSPFLALFGRSARATGLASERENKPLPAQWLELLNSSHIQAKLEQGPKLKGIIDSRRPPAAILDELYLTILSRHPTPAELAAAEAYDRVPVPQGAARPGAGRRPRPVPPAKQHADRVDLAWALINSTEFLYRH